MLILLRNPITTPSPKSTLRSVNFSPGPFDKNLQEQFARMLRCISTAAKAGGGSSHAGVTDTRKPDHPPATLRDGGETVIWRIP